MEASPCGERTSGADLVRASHAAFNQPGPIDIVFCIMPGDCSGAAVSEDEEAECTAQQKQTHDPGGTTQPSIVFMGATTWVGLASIAKLAQPWWHGTRNHECQKSMYAPFLAENRSFSLGLAVPAG